MILEFGARNFYSFKEGVAVSFEYSGRCPNEISKGRRAANVIGLIGANGSGKTNILKALSFLSTFATDSFSEKPDAEIPFYSFFGSEDPSELYIEFEVNEVWFRYELKLTRWEVLSETVLQKKPGKRKSVVIDRLGGEFKQLSPGYESLNVIKMRKNASVISVANQYDIEVIKPIYRFFSIIVSNVHSPLGMTNASESVSRVDSMTEKYKKYPDYFEFAKKIIKSADIGISDITLMEREIDADSDKKKYSPVFHFEVDGEQEFLTYFEQSSGTKSLFIKLGLYKAVLDIGGVLAIDELDLSLHPMIVIQLLKIFDDEDENPKNAQLLFTAHAIDTMEWLGKYQTYLVNKENNESFAYRLDEIPGDVLRNDRPITPIYRAGKIGGVPKL